MYDDWPKFFFLLKLYDNTAYFKCYNLKFFIGLKVKKNYYL